MKRPQIKALGPRHIAGSDQERQGCPAARQRQHRNAIQDQEGQRQRVQLNPFINERPAECVVQLLYQTEWAGK